MFLSILRIIGIVLLVILALLILILGMILLVPVRYQFAGEYKENPEADILVKWTPVFLKVTANYRENKFEYMVRIFGGVIMTNMDVPLSWLGKKLFTSSDEEFEYDDDPDDEVDVEANLKKNASFNPMNNNLKKNTSSTPTDNNIKKKPSNKIAQVDKIAKENESFFVKIRKRLLNVKAKVNQWIDKMKRLNDKREALLKVYNSRRFKIAKKDVIQYIKNLWSIVRPKKLKGYIHFGLSDPSSTGQALGVMAMFLIWYDDFLKVEPDFEKSCIDGYLNGKGRFRLFSIVKLLIKIAFNKNLIKVLKKVQNIIEV